MSFLYILKKVPIDLGQGHLRKDTKGKIIAFSWVQESKGKKALDVGCREGYQSKLLEERGYKVTSIDIEKKYEKCRIVDVNKKLPFKDNYFDLIWCSEVIEHLKDPVKSVEEFRRIVKPSGVMIMTTPNSYCFLFRFLSLLGLTPEKIQNKDHKHFFNIQDINKIFSNPEIVGFFPYFLIKLKIKSHVSSLSPTFVIKEMKE